MQTPLLQSDRSTADAGVARLGPRTLVLLWLASGVILLAVLNVPAVLRTQEARVLESAREMLGGGFHGWMVPHLNGDLRLQKPPLAYWLAATGFSVLGVSEWAGRLPLALAGWLTVGIVYLAARWLFNRRAAFFAATSLFGCYMFSRHAQLAETDVLVGLFVTVAIYCLWRGSGLWTTAGEQGGAAAVRDPGIVRGWWYHASAAAIGLAALSKGLPALFPILFFIALAGLSRRWGILWQWVRCGAPLTLAVIALPWFVYLSQVPEFQAVAGKELSDVMSGRDHGGWFFVYFADMLAGTLPWSAMFVAAVWAAIDHAREDWRLRGCLVWAMGVFLPLCVAWNKQAHYLVPLLPPLMILVGWVLDLSLRPEADRPLVQGMRICLGISLLGLSLGAVAMIVAPRMLVGRIRPGDVALGVAIFLLAAGVWRLFQRRGLEPALLAYALGVAAMLPLITGIWLPSLNLSDSRASAAAITTAFGDGPYASFGGDGPHLPLCFSMRRVIPHIRTADELQQAADRMPGLAVIVKVEKGMAALPVDFVPRLTVGTQDEQFRIYQSTPPAPATTRRN